jgi:hypothetical protein
MNRKSDISARKYLFLFRVLPQGAAMHIDFEQQVPSGNAYVLRVAMATCGATFAALQKRKTAAKAAVI